MENIHYFLVLTSRTCSISYSVSSSELSFSDTDFGVVSASFFDSISGSFFGTFGDFLDLVGDGLIFRFFGLGLGLDSIFGFDSEFFSVFLEDFFRRNFSSSSDAVSSTFFAGSHVGSQGSPFSSTPDHLTRYLVLPLNSYLRL